MFDERELQIGILEIFSDAQHENVRKPRGLLDFTERVSGYTFKSSPCSDYWCPLCGSQTDAHRCPVQFADAPPIFHVAYRDPHKYKRKRYG